MLLERHYTQLNDGGHIAETELPALTISSALSQERRIINSVLEEERRLERMNFRLSMKGTASAHTGQVNQREGMKSWCAQ